MASPRLNLGRYSRIGHIYSITTVACRRRPVLTTEAAAGTIRTELQSCDNLGLSTSLAWVLMPDHLHWLFQLDSGSLSAIVQRLKARTALAFNRASNCRGSLWQAGFHDHCIRSEESLGNVALYLLHNPIRAGLTERIDDYPHWWCVWDLESVRLLP